MWNESLRLVKIFLNSADCCRYAIVLRSVKEFYLVGTSKMSGSVLRNANIKHLFEVEQCYFLIHID